MIRLIKVEADENNNKFYHMEDNGNGTFKANWGRVGAKGQFKDFLMSDWNSKLNSKLKKGYVDITEMSSVSTSTNGIDAGRSQPIVDFLMNSANSSIEDNYLVGADAVTQAQVEEAQNLLNNVAKLIRARKSAAMTVDQVNYNLKLLYTTIPRKMGKVKDHMATTVKRATEILTLEQANLDVMQGQVVQPVQEANSQGLSSFGIQIEPVLPADIDRFIKPRLDYLKGNFKRAWEVSNVKTQKAYEDNYASTGNPEQMLLWHGSRNENWWSILRQGLLVRPTNAVHTGSMWGDGLYFADYDRKSYGYTSGRGSYWAKGSQNRAILALYDVHVGKQYHIRQHEYGHSSLNWDKIQNKGKYDSVFAEKGMSLRNNEYIVYRSQQCTIQYLIEVES